MRTLNIGTWNVRTLMDSVVTVPNRKQRRTTVVRRELCRYTTEIAVLSETRLVRDGCQRSWCCGVDANVRRGLKQEGFAFKLDLVGKLSGLQKASMTA